MSEHPDWYDRDQRRGELQTVSVHVHFESESATRQFLAKSTWRRVHRWGCKKFKVSSDACANLELRKDSPDGPALNESKEIGDHEEPLTVWLVKPGAEPNGR